MKVIANPTKRVHPAVQTHSVAALSILQSAISAFDAAEYSTVSIHQIAEHAGVSKSLITYYFPTKGMLGAAVLSQAYASGVFMGIERQADCPLEAIAQGLEHVAYSVAHDALARVALKLHDEPEFHQSNVSVRHYGWLTRIADYLEEARRAGLIRDESDIKRESRLFVAGLVGLIALSMQAGVFLSLAEDVSSVTRQRITSLSKLN